ncbi:MAG: cellulose biosynthesis cyclic di-GMP-binding regulatory protein BcsB [Anaerolineae bacterium]|nr:cellulose biosynthesis cyclic di-GMP-binding regulatory protein BcsB [Anaerolineae bacterium]
MRRMRKHVLKALLLCLVAFQLSLTGVGAQEPEDDQAITFDSSGRLNITFAQLGYESETMSRDNIQSSFRLDLPGNFKIAPSGNYLNLVTSHFPENPDKPAQLSVVANKSVVYSFPLTSSNALSGTTRVDFVPDGLLTTGRNNIDVNLIAEGSCEDPGGPLDIVIGGDSVLSFEYQQQPYSTDLGNYPWPFVENSVLDIPVVIVLPDQPAEYHLSTAATIAAGLGDASNGTINVTAVTESGLTPELQENAHLIFIGEPSANEAINDLDLTIPITGNSIKPGYGVLEEVVSPWNEFRLALVVSGLDSEGVLKAGQALNRQANFLGMRGPVAVVVDLGPVPQANQKSSSTVTFADLAYDDQIFYGIVPQNQTIRFDLPLGWQFDEPPYVALKFAHAEAINPESIIDVKLNRVPIGSALLDETNSGDGELVLSLPTRLLEEGSNRLDITVEMAFGSETDKCANLNNQRAWTVISSDSEIYIPYNTTDLAVDLQYFPNPFSQASSFEQTMFVVPDQLDAQTLNAMVQVAIRLGSASGSVGTTSARVAYADEVDQSNLARYHVIMFGQPTENSLLMKINDKLPHPFIEEGTALKPLVVDSVAFLPDPERDAGLLQIFDSPWNDKNTVLAITGIGDNGVALASQALLERTEDLKGNLAIVEPVEDVFADDPSQITIFSTDTRSLTAPRNGEESSIIGDTLSEEARADVANRWWK